METYITPDVIKVKTLDNYILEVTFETKEIKIFDMKNLINNIEFYKRLKNKDYFKKVKPYNETVIWEKGEDVCPEDLYYNSIEIKKNKTYKRKIKNGSKNHFYFVRI